MYKRRKSLLLTSLLHPIKFLSRFLISYIIFTLILCFIIQIFLPSFVDFIIYTEIGTFLERVCLAIFAMRWVREEVEVEENTPQSVKEEKQKEKEQRRAQMMHASLWMVEEHQKKRMRDERARQDSRRRMMERTAAYYYEESRKAHFKGDRDLEDRLYNEARHYWTMR